MKKEKIKLFGLNIDNIEMPIALDKARSALNGSKAPLAVFTPNLQMLEASRKDKNIRKMLNSADILLPDGVGVVLVSKMLGRKIKCALPGIEFGEKILKIAEQKGFRVFLLGGKEGIASLAAARLKKKLKDLKICGTHHGYITSDKQRDGLIEKINKSKADILFVCMGFPRQERFVLENREKLKRVRLIACLGGSLDVWSGKVRRAPKPFRKMHAEWLWRLSCEPCRIPRFLSSLPTIAVSSLCGLKNIISKKDKYRSYFKERII